MGGNGLSGEGCKVRQRHSVFLSLFSPPQTLHVIYGVRVDGAGRVLVDRQRKEERNVKSGGLDALSKSVNRKSHRPAFKERFCVMSVTCSHLW